MPNSRLRFINEKLSQSEQKMIRNEINRILNKDGSISARSRFKYYLTEYLKNVIDLKQISQKHRLVMQVPIAVDNMEELGKQYKEIKQLYMTPEKIFHKEGTRRVRLREDKESACKQLILNEIKKRAEKLESQLLLDNWEQTTISAAVKSFLEMDTDIPVSVQLNFAIQFYTTPIMKQELMNEHPELLNVGISSEHMDALKETKATIDDIYKHPYCIFQDLALKKNDWIYNANYQRAREDKVHLQVKDDQGVFQCAYENIGYEQIPVYVRKAKVDASKHLITKTVIAHAKKLSETIRKEKNERDEKDIDQQLLAMVISESKQSQKDEKLAKNEDRQVSSQNGEYNVSLIKNLYETQIMMLRKQEGFQKKQEDLLKALVKSQKQIAESLSKVYSDMPAERKQPTTSISNENITDHRHETRHSVRASFLWPHDDRYRNSQSNFSPPVFSEPEEVIPVFEEDNDRNIRFSSGTRSRYSFTR